MRDEIGAVQEYVLQHRHQALLIKSILRYFSLSEPSEFSAGVKCSHFCKLKHVHKYWLICFLRCINRVGNKMCLLRQLQIWYLFG